MSRHIALVVASAVIAVPAFAQGIVSGDPSTAATAPPSKSAFVLSAGTDVLGRDFGDATPGLSGHAGYERRIGGAGSPFAIRIAGDYWRTSRTFIADVAGQGPRDVERTTTIVGGSALGVLRLPSLSALRPYALAGVGVQQYANRNETPWVPSGTNTASKSVYLPPVRVNSIAYSGGLGASMRVGNVTPFAEVRLVYLPGLSELGVQQVRSPLTLGVRF